MITMTLVQWALHETANFDILKQKKRFPLGYFVKNHLKNTKIRPSVFPTFTHTISSYLNQRTHEQTKLE
jgi:hypothetical protein